MEKNPQPQDTHYIDLIADADYQDFRQQVHDVELKAAQSYEDEELSTDALYELDELLGVNTGESEAVYSGLAYPLDKSGDPDVSEEPQIFFDKKIIKYGSTYQDVDDRFRVWFEFKEDSQERDTTYATPFDGILRLEVGGHTGETAVIGALRRHAAISQELTSDPEFLAADATDQQHSLMLSAIACFSELEAEYELEDLSIECSKFYQFATTDYQEGDMPDLIDQTERHFEDRDPVVGNIVGVMYLESEVRPEMPLRSAEDFYNNGVPCVVVYDERTNNMSYVPIDAVEKIECND